MHPRQQPGHALGQPDHQQSARRRQQGRGEATQPLHPLSQSCLLQLADAPRTILIKTAVFGSCLLPHVGSLCVLAVDT